MAIDNEYEGEVVDGATNFQKEGDSRVRPVKSYRQVKSPRAGSLPRHAPSSQPKCPTDKLKEYRVAVYRDTYREVNRQVYREVDQDST
jgi:hypothetical protein